MLHNIQLNRIKRSSTEKTEQVVRGYSHAVQDFKDGLSSMDVDYNSSTFDFLADGQKSKLPFHF